MSFKILSKIIVNRLMHIMEYIISPYQYGLINSRRIHDSNIVAQEILHSIHRTMGKQGCFVMKIYLAKAYEKLNWSFLDKVIHEVRLPDKMKSIIMEAISSVKMTFL